MGFWDRQLSDLRGPAQPPTHQGPLGYSPPPEQAQGRAQEQPDYVRRQLAIRHAGPQEQNLAMHIQREGYIKRPPEWVQRQPHDTCPNCGGPDMAAISMGGYSRPGLPGTILRCFDCGWSSSRGVSALWGVPSSGPVVGAAVQSRDGQVSLRNTGLITA